MTRKQPSGFSVIILAAGSAERFGTDKLRSKLGDRTMLEHAIARAAQVSPGEIIVVSTPELRALVVEIESPVTIVAIVPPSSMAGTAGGSIACGMESIPVERDFTFVHLADKPLVPPEVYRISIAIHLEEPRRIIVPSHRGERGHPVLFPKTFFPELKRLEGIEGGRIVLDMHPDSVLCYESGSETVTIDIDSPEEYREYVRKFQSLIDADIDPDCS